MTGKSGICAFLGACAALAAVGSLRADVKGNVVGRTCHRGSVVPYRVWVAPGYWDGGLICPEHLEERTK